MYILDLPEEIFLVTAGCLHFLELVRLRQVCSQWKTSVDSSPTTQYSISLGLAGRRESRFFNWPIKDKLLALHAAQSMRDSGRLSHWGSALNSDRSMINMKLLGSGLIMASHPRRDPTPNGEDPKRVVHLTAPDLLHDDDHIEGSLKQWTLVIPSITTVMDILAIDPAQNLIIQRANRPESGFQASSNVQMYFAAITLDSAAPHPNYRSPSAVTAVPAPADWVINEPHYTRYQILETSMLVIFADIRRCAAVLLNWCSGEILACFVPEPQLRMSIGGSAASIALLSESSILHGTHDKFMQAPCIGLYVLEKSSPTCQDIQQPSPTGRLHLIRRYFLPSLQFYAYARVNINPFPQDRLLPKDRGPYFREDLLSSMLSVTLDVTIDDDDDPRSFTFYTPIYPFLIAAKRSSSTSTVIPWVEWEQWGPRLTRWIGGQDGKDSLDTSYLSCLPYYREGSRILASDHFIDFAPFRIKHAKTRQDLARATPSASEPEETVLDLGGYTLIEKPTILKSNVFKDGQVTSRLPFLERQIDMPEAVSYILIGDSVMLVSEGYVNMEVYALAK